ncbi:MAG TPA: dienelactone hydrolase family protein [Verrucomicrobiae bacterium]|nr:dienelactone hydrolase family protein [Verrucomicrobiae bacterium]
MRFNGLILGLLGAALLTSARAEIVTKSVEYKEGDTTLEGWVAYDDSVKGARPGVLIVHQWKGLGAYEKMRAEMLAKMGFVAFACDIYGKGIRPTAMQDAAAQAGKYKNDRLLLRKRVNAGLETLLKQEGVDKKKVAAIGYCFGGTTVLELARSGADVGGVVSFHGGLGSPTPEDAKNIKAKVLALHGADDPNVPPTEVSAFEKEMRDAKVDWQLVAYGNAVHSFTDKGAGNDNSKGAAYNEKADRRSWEDMKDFFVEFLGKP